MSLEDLLIKAWNERMTPLAWSANCLSLMNRIGVTEMDLANLLLRQFVSSVSPRIYIQYFTHSLSSSLIDATTFFASLSSLLSDIEITSGLAEILLIVVEDFLPEQSQDLFLSTSIYVSRILSKKDIHPALKCRFLRFLNANIYQQFLSSGDTTLLQKKQELANSLREISSSVEDPEVCVEDCCTESLTDVVESTIRCLLDPSGQPSVRLRQADSSLKASCVIILRLQSRLYVDENSHCFWLEVRGVAALHGVELSIVCATLLTTCMEMFLKSEGDRRCKFLALLIGRIPQVLETCARTSGKDTFVHEVKSELERTMTEEFSKDECVVALAMAMEKQFGDRIPGWATAGGNRSSVIPSFFESQDLLAKSHFDRMFSCESLEDPIDHVAVMEFLRQQLSDRITGEDLVDLAKYVGNSKPAIEVLSLHGLLPSFISSLLSALVFWGSRSGDRTSHMSYGYLLSTLVAVIQRCLVPSGVRGDALLKRLWLEIPSQNRTSLGKGLSLASRRECVPQILEEDSLSNEIAEKLLRSLRLIDDDQFVHTLCFLAYNTEYLIRVLVPQCSPEQLILATPAIVEGCLRSTMSKNVGDIHALLHYCPGAELIFCRCLLAHMEARDWSQNSVGNSIPLIVGKSLDCLLQEKVYDVDVPLTLREACRELLEFRDRQDISDSLSHRPFSAFLREEQSDETLCDSLMRFSRLDPVDRSCLVLGMFVEEIRQCSVVEKCGIVLLATLAMTHFGVRQSTSVTTLLECGIPSLLRSVSPVGSESWIPWIADLICTTVCMVETSDVHDTLRQQLHRASVDTDSSSHMIYRQVNTRCWENCTCMSILEKTKITQ